MQKNPKEQGVTTSPQRILKVVVAVDLQKNPKEQGVTTKKGNWSSVYVFKFAEEPERAGCDSSHMAKQNPKTINMFL